MVTKEQATVSNRFHFKGCTRVIGPKGGVKVSQIVLRRNGKTKTWVTRPGAFRIPVKYGLKFCTYITNDNAHEYHTESECPINQEED